MFKIRIHQIIAICSFIIYLIGLFYPLSAVNGSILSQKTLIILIAGIIAWFLIESIEEYFKNYNKKLFYAKKAIQIIYIILTVLVIVA